MTVKDFKEKFPDLAHLEGNELWDAMERTNIIPYIPKEGDDEIVETVEISGYTFNLTKAFVDSVKAFSVPEGTTPFKNAGLLIPNQNKKP